MNQQKHSGSWRSWKVGSVPNTGLFSGVDTEAVQKLTQIQKATPNIQLRAEQRKWSHQDNASTPHLVIEALVVISWRGSITSIPRAIIPNTSRDGFTLFSLDEKGVPRSPVPIRKPTTMAFLDWVHLEDTKCKFRKSKWGILKAYRDMRQQTPHIEISEIPDNVLDNSSKNIPRSCLRPIMVYRSSPAFEVDSTHWYYEDLLRRMGSFLSLGQAMTTNNLTKYYQYLGMKLGDFNLMYSFDPSTNVIEYDDANKATQTTPVADTVLTIREQIMMASKDHQPLPTPVPSEKKREPLTIGEHIKTVRKVTPPTEKKKKIILTGE